MKKALFPGTFDPPTLGHFHVIRKVGKLCEKLYVGIAINPSKRGWLFSVEERMEMLQKIAADLPNVEVVYFDGLVVDFAEKLQVDCLIRGLRDSSEFDHEYCMSLTNRVVGDVETLFFMTGENVRHISSTLIREIAANGKRLQGFVPEEIEEQVFLRCQERVSGKE